VKIFRKINNFLSVVAICLSILLLALPLTPDIVFYYKKFIKNSNEFYSNKYDFTNKVDLPIENRLIIPNILVDGQIHEGLNESALDLGVWRRPHTSNPKDGGNTVLAAHRSRYLTGGDTFYHLDKIKKEDSIIIYWEGLEYNYIVKDIFEVNEEDLSIESNSSQNVVTLYTCTPLFSNDKRLVVKAYLQ
jgi:sortase A